MAKDFNIKFEKCLNLIDAIKKIDANLKSNEVALLSPAASSLDEYNSYAARGDEFKNCVTGLK